MYRHSARVYDALCRHKDYGAACETLRGLLGRVAPGATSLLDVACGTGQHLQHLRAHFSVQGLDASREMLAIARDRCPGIPFHEGSLEDFRLPDRFDVVTPSVSILAEPLRRQAAADLAGALPPEARELGRAGRILAQLQREGALVYMPLEVRFR